ncbi:hypothetical protein I540_2893 [Mycobacteroides abscessus subsp. bolletii 1513]|uniref:Uncharacterized protein n=1 Tax=Mycobacteroides abscessus subsp. bolletii 1513 TaxID=1299321 RepID=X8DWT6_9MYCO|nr:hypothetical protein I540_2893 [Mycobacteroides abscessus subsp. bolletii 1513]
MVSDVSRVSPAIPGEPHRMVCVVPRSSGFDVGGASFLDWRGAHSVRRYSGPGVAVSGEVIGVPS